MTRDKRVHDGLLMKVIYLHAISRTNIAGSQQHQVTNRERKEGSKSSCLKQRLRRYTTKGSLMLHLKLAIPHTTIIAEGVIKKIQRREVCLNSAEHRLNLGD